MPRVCATYTVSNSQLTIQGLKEDDLEAALEGFDKVLQHEEEVEEKGDWGFKAKKQKIKVLYNLSLESSSNKAPEIATAFKALLEDVENGKVSRNYAEKSLNNLLEFLSGMATADTDNANTLKQIYDSTLQALIQTGNERMWIKTKMKLAKLYLEQKDVDNARVELEQIEKACTGSDSSTGGGVSEDDNTKSTFLMEAYSLLMQLYSSTSNFKKVKELYSKTMSIKTAVSHPRILGIIHECGGKIHMREKRWEAAREDLFESFKNYDEAGSLQRIQVLKYFVLACMLSESGINPFESQETKPYKQDPNVMVMMHLVEAFQRSDVEEFNKLLKAHRTEIMDDELIKSFLDEVILSIRSQGIINLVKPYTRVTFQHIATSLEITAPQARDIVARLILDHRLPTARIDMSKDVVELQPEGAGEGQGRLAPLVGTADVPVFHENMYRGLPVATADSLKSARAAITAAVGGASVGASGSSSHNSKKKLLAAELKKKDERSDTAEDPRAPLTADSSSTTAQPEDDTHSGRKNSHTHHHKDDAASGRKNSHTHPKDDSTNTAATVHTQRRQLFVSESLQGTALVSREPFAAFPARYAKALADEASVESGKRVVSASAKGGAGAATSAGAGGGDGDAGDAGETAGGAGANDGSAGGEGLDRPMDLLAVDRPGETGGAGGVSDGADSQNAALQEWVSRVLDMQAVIHGNPRAVQVTDV